VNGKEIPKLHLDQAEDSATPVKLTDFFEDFRIIPLETRKECLIMNTALGFTGNSILVCTQQGGLGPCRVLEFNFNGKYIKEFGRGGKGPGEHVGYMAEELSWYPGPKEVLISFSGMGDENQIFSLQGEFMKSVKIPIELTQGIKKFNDTLFMTTGAIAGRPMYRRDSLRLIFYTAEGTEIKSFPRPEYPPAGNKGYTAFGWRESLYPYANEWRLYSPGDDTLYRVSPDRLTPMAIFSLGPKGTVHNKVIDVSAMTGSYSVAIKRETEKSWYLVKTVITKTDFHEFGPGQWGGSLETKEFLLVVDKKTGTVRNIRFEDDFLGLASKHFNRDQISWSETGEPYITYMAMELKESIKESLKKENLDPAIRARLEKLDREVTADSNPVIVMMKVRED
jgi:hypothetical protein